MQLLGCSKISFAVLFPDPTTRQEFIDSFKIEPTPSPIFADPTGDDSNLDRKSNFRRKRFAMSRESSKMSSVEADSIETDSVRRSTSPPGLLTEEYLTPIGPVRRSLSPAQYGAKSISPACHNELSPTPVALTEKSQSPVRILDRSTSTSGPNDELTIPVDQKNFLFHQTHFEYFSPESVSGSQQDDIGDAQQMRKTDTTSNPNPVSNYFIEDRLSVVESCDEDDEEQTVNKVDDRNDANESHKDLAASSQENGDKEGSSSSQNNGSRLKLREQ